MEESSTKYSRRYPLTGAQNKENNVPLQAPLYPSDGVYGSDDFESISVLLEVNEHKLLQVCEGTPFCSIGSRIWVEFMAMPSCRGIAPYSGGGVIIPVRCGN